MRSLTWLRRRAPGALLVVGVLAVPLAAQNTGTITGTITDATSRQPLASTRVSVAGTALQALTDSRGIYRLSNVPAGQVRMQVRRIAYRADEKIFTLNAGEESTQNFALMASAMTLEEVVVTGTAGDQRRKAQGATVAEISVSDVMKLSPISTFEEVLQSRSPGVSVTLASGTSGAYSSIRIRGGASISLSNEPLVYVDGVQITSGAANLFFTGGQATGRLSELNPEDIESVEIVKGPAAATLYGANASAGVVQIMTKRGRQGSAFSQNLTVSHDNIDPSFTPPSNFAFCSAASIAPTSTNPLCRGKTTTTLVSDNPLVRESAFRHGVADELQWSGRGGGTNFGYYISGLYSKEKGTTPNNGFDRRGGRVNYNWTPTSKLSFDANVGLNRTGFVLPDNDNNVYGYLGGGLLGTPLTRSDSGKGNNGWFGSQRDVAAIRSIENDQQTHRTIGSATATYVPYNWWTTRMVLGADWLRDEIRRFLPKNARGSYQGLSNTGDISERRQGSERYTVDLLSNVRLSSGHDLVHNLSAGFQSLDFREENVSATGQGLTVNSNNVVSAASSRSANQDFNQQRQVGFLGQYQGTWRDRLSTTVGARWDANSSFGNSSEWFFLPKVGVSYVISEEPFWANRFSFVSTMRLRGAWGQTGRSPTPGAALNRLTPAPYVLAGVESPGAIPLNPGNDSLKAERGEEFEGGFDLGVLNERAGLELTYYHKTSKDLLLQRPLPPSLGYVDPSGQNLNQPFVNIGALRNTGFEVAVNGTPLQGENLNWDARVSLATLKTKILNMGNVPPFGTLNRFEKGYEPGMFVGLRIRSIDTTSRTTCGPVTYTTPGPCVIVGDDYERIGPVLPTLESNFSTSLTLLRNIRLSALVDGKFGNYLYNLTDFFRETQLVRSDRRLDTLVLSKSERLRRYGNQTAGQPAFVREGKKAGFAPTATVNEVRDAYVQKANFVKFRELSLSYTLPEQYAARMKSKSAIITVSGRNLHTWTDYEGFDPELLSAATTNYSRLDFLTIPPGKRWGISLNLAF